jgi:hypothetical protein
MMVNTDMKKGYVTTSIPATVKYMQRNSAAARRQV